MFNEGDILKVINSGIHLLILEKLEEHYYTLVLDYGQFHHYNQCALDEICTKAA